MNFANLPETGLLLDGTPFASLPFVEGDGLHFKPPVTPVPPVNPVSPPTGTPS
jgi:NADH-quinone oxidoreductase subunit G